MKWIRRHKGKLIPLAILVVLAYFNSLNNEFVSDDIFAIVNSDSLGDFSQVFSNPFYFLRELEYFVVFSLFGKQAIYFRLINFVFHLLAVWGVYALVELLVSEYVGFIAAMLFAVHPLGAEAVSWISAGVYVQMTALSIWSLVFYVLTIRGEKKYYVWSVLLLLLALFSMERSVVVVGIMVVVTFLLGDLKKYWKYLLVPAGLSLDWLGVSVLGAGVRQEVLQVNYYNNPENINFFIQLPVAISEYLKLFVWPIGLTLYHSDLFFTGLSFFLKVVVTLGYLGCVVWGFFKNRQVFFWLLFFLICLSPTLLPFGLSWIVAERYVYMAMIGLCVVTGMGFSYLNTRFGVDGVNFILILLVSMLMLRTVLRNNNWQTADELWFSAERYSTLSPQNHNNLGDAYGRRGRLELSRDHFLRAIELNPRYADAMHNLGNTYLQMGEIDKAKESYEQALKVNPKLWQSEERLKAIEEYERKNL
mgnify:FL=1